MIKILFLAASPIDQNQLRLGKEMSEIKARIESPGHRKMLLFDHEMAAQACTLQEHLLRFKPHIVHFSGHGSKLGESIFEDEAGYSKPVSAEILKKLFSVLRDNIRCVVLNACYSNIQAQAIAESIDCVIGMSKEVSDEAAIAFSAGFYQALCCGCNIKEAYDLGCISISMGIDKPDEAHKPHLILSPGVHPESISLTRSRTDKEIKTEPVVTKILEPLEECLENKKKIEDPWYDPENDIKKINLMFDSLVKCISESKLHECIATTNSWILSEELKNYYSSHSQLPHSVRILQAFLGKDFPLDLSKEDIAELYPVIPKLLDDFRCGLTKWPEFNEVITRKEQQLNQPRYGLPGYILNSGYILNYSNIIQNRTDIFGGRSEEMKQIESFIFSDKPGYLVIEGKSGMGKTALLANIIDKFPLVAYHFFSIASSSENCDLTKESFAIPSICEQIEFIKNGWVESTRQYSRESLIRLLQEKYPSHTQPVLILDGLDEAENVEFMNGFFPKQLQDRLKVIFSYRSLAVKGIPRDHYLLKMGLSRRDIDCFITLERFNRDRIAELFGQLAGKVKTVWKNQDALHLLNRIEGNDQLLNQITEKSEGDPFYLRFLVEDIRNGAITEDNILEIPTGLEEYLQKELENLEKRANGEVSIDVVGIISSSDDDDPWPEEDLIIKLKESYNHSNITRAIFRNQVIPSIRRYLYQVGLGKDRHGDEKLGYKIIHPRLKEYFARMLS
jgi:hypothetical protein